jgi:serine/threonine protein kinase
MTYVPFDPSPKPPLPCVPGQEFWVFSHVPPSPPLRQGSFNPVTWKENSEMSPMERCILHPPALGQTGTDPIHLKVVEPIRTGDNHAAQLVTVRILHAPQNLSMALPMNEYLVAKFYDPLYFDHNNDDGDPCLWVDKAYTHETAAYEMLRPLQGTTVPRYYGSYTLELPVPDKEATRSIRLIIMELVPGIDMRSLNPADFSRETRQNLMKAIVDAESLIYAHNVHHRDTHPRNIMVFPQSLQTTSIQILLIDFGNSEHRVPSWAGWCTPEVAQHFLPGVPITPILRWDSSNVRNRPFANWIDWDWDFWLDRHYGAARASITDDMIKHWMPKKYPWTDDESSDGEV